MIICSLALCLIIALLLAMAASIHCCVLIRYRVMSKVSPPLAYITSSRLSYTDTTRMFPPRRPVENSLYHCLFYRFIIVYPPCLTASISLGSIISLRPPVELLTLSYQTNWILPLRAYPTRSKKFCSRGFPMGVRIDSGWNWTPSTGYSLWRKPMINPSSVQAVTSRQSGKESR